MSFISKVLDAFSTAANSRPALFGVFLLDSKINDCYISLYRLAIAVL